MFIDLEKIQIFKWDSPNLSEPVCVLNTAEVLSPYGLIPDKWLSAYHLGGRAGSWLRDLGSPWKSEKRIAEKQIAAIGLLPLLKDGSFEPEVEIRIDSKLKYIVLRYYHPRPEYL